MKSKLIDTKPKTWEWTLREELVKAIEELNIFSDDSYSDDDLVLDIGKSDISSDTTPFEYSGKSKNKKNPVYIQNKYVYPRSRKVSINALRHANYKCELDNTHLTFTRRNSDLNYTEPHHLVPITYQNNFKVMLEKLYNERKDLLKMVGIDISLDELIKLYKNDKC